MSVKVELSSVARNKLMMGGVQIPEFKLELSEMLSGAGSVMFGRNVQNNNSSHVWHIHFMPVDDPSELEKWMDNIENGRKSYDRTSDNLIFYTLDSLGTCLVIEFMAPKGHKRSFKNRQFLHNLEMIAEGFIYKGIIE
jgi:hypothetical protein